MTISPERFVQFLLARRTRYVAAWIIAIGFAVGRILNGHLAFQDKRPRSDPNRRVDGNHGHNSIDFGGQWVMGRMLARGYGRELYHRARLWEVVQQAYPKDREPPDETKHDADQLMSYILGPDDLRWNLVACSLSAVILPATPFERAGVAIDTQYAWTNDRIEELRHPAGPEGIGGPLYPPIQAFLMLPFATGDHPQAAYFVMQYLQMLLCFVAALGVSRLSQGRFWWPMAAAFILIYPGCRGTIDLGQNSALSLALLIWGWVWLSRGRPITSGVIWGCLAYKPVWALSFLILLLVIRQWRMAMIMAVTGAAIALATVPFVGVQAWRDWLTVGQLAATIYNVDVNWVPLSRDLLGIPRRVLIDFSIVERLERENPLALAASWALWAFVMEITLRVYFVRKRGPVPFTGPLPAMLILAAWMCSFHFMYYDSLISAFGFCVLLADPKPWFRMRRLDDNAALTDDPSTADPRSIRPLVQLVKWFVLSVVTSFVLSVLTLMLFHENVTQILKLEATILHVGTHIARRLDSNRASAVCGWEQRSLSARHADDHGSVGLVLH